ncbi:protein PLASTID MOVEMENT IMPAIRED 1-RELATED 1-like [Benincasa hispida]|uniref:protein PLASTID MOVEMENT IMPAIRED 1-RELATED 1-like n=1 Tax=Benincasa hispida TaxID=102211 RepID=UPI0019006A0D|nr:protein PLASTID MOVEMENT IMPAIRED 1-RELATED 1-like [Benincasa hispida]XP_038884621.1 protein PLASTID MOVEMENT IMPAIRED 1-RELATED 1-like [Benincasa hispida]
MKSENGDGLGESDGGRLLEEIEAISKALYLHKGHTNSIFCPPDGRSGSHLAESRSRFNQRYHKDGESLVDETERRSSSTWNWKKSLKALTHIRHRKFNCVFYLKVHSIEGLPSSFNGYSLSVHWKRKDEVLQTRPSKVFQGMAEFDETLIHKCVIYGGKSLANHSAKYDPKLYLIYVSMLGAPQLDFGKHWVDLTRILPLTLEELEGDKCSGNWSTSFRLAGNARGASLNVSFSFLVTKDDPMKLSGPENVVQLLKLLHHKSRLSNHDAHLNSTNFNGLPNPDGNNSHNLEYGSITSTQIFKTGIFDELNPNVELSESINLLYSKMDEAGQHKSEHSGSELAEQLELKSNEEHKSDEVIGGGNYDSGEFSIIECGIELAGTEDSLDKVDQTTEGSKEETISLDDEIIKDDKVAIEIKSSIVLKDAVCDIHVDDTTGDDFEYEENNLTLKVEEVASDELSSDSDLKWTSRSVETDSPLAVGELVECENVMDAKENCARKSLSLDDSYESVASDFLKMLGLEHGSARFSDPDILSPRERLLREFEEESLIFGNPLLDCSATEEWQDFGGVDMEFASENQDEDFDFSSIYVAEEVQEEGHQSLRNRRNAKILEDLETEHLMREWGLNERDFEHSPHYSSSGFGSPIELPLEEEPPKLCLLGEGFGAFLKMNGGGFLRSMSPWLSQNTSIGQSLVIQCSEPVVLPAELGHDIMEIAQNLALAGTENLSTLAKKLMPLDNITGKTLQQMVSECSPSSSTTLLEREPMIENNVLCSSVSCCERKDLEGLPSCKKDSSLQSLMNSEMHQDLVSPDDLACLAMEKMETLLIEGLRIQSGLTNDETPARISARPFHCLPARGRRHSNSDSSCRLEGLKELQFMDRPNTAGDVVGLMELSITLEHWLSLDAGNINDDDKNGQHIMKTLVAHGANYADIIERLSKDINSGISSNELGLFGNKLVVALMVQLRDHLRDYEPVGGPMMCVMEVERFFINTARDTASEMSSANNGNEPLQAQEDSHETNHSQQKADGHFVRAFKISAIHLLGVNSVPNKMQFWGTTMQQQSGSRWLLSSGMGRNFKLPLSKSKAIVQFSSLGTKAPAGDILWSISSDIHEGMISKSLASSSHKRNPDIVILNQSINLHIRCS